MRIFSFLVSILLFAGCASNLPYVDTSDVKKLEAGMSTADVKNILGKPIKIQFLAEKIIELSGKKLGEDIEIKYTGLRPGEKLFEELHYDFEEQTKVSEKLFLVNSGEFDVNKLESSINNILQKIKLRKDSIILDCLRDLVFPEKEPKNENVAELFDKVEV